MQSEIDKPAAAVVGEPDGWKLVPIVPTQRMIDAGKQWTKPSYIYDAMLETAPSAPDGWQPIESFDPQERRAPWSEQVLCAHSVKKWVRFGRYDLTLKRWYYSGTNERSQWSQIEGDEPTHWQPIPNLPSPPSTHSSDKGSEKK